MVAWLDSGLERVEEIPQVFPCAEGAVFGDALLPQLLLFLERRHWIAHGAAVAADEEIGLVLDHAISGISPALRFRHAFVVAKNWWDERPAGVKGVAHEKNAK